MAYNSLGYRFRPTEDEIINHFLDMKMRDPACPVQAVKTLNICAFEPWQLPELSAVSDDEEWFFFSELKKKYANSDRADRTTKLGYWKVTGNDRQIWDNCGKEVIGVKKNLVFHKGRGSKAKRTNWVIHEYHSSKASVYQKPYVLCRLRGNLDDKPENYSRGESSGHAGTPSATASE